MPFKPRIMIIKENDCQAQAPIDVATVVVTLELVHAT